MCIFHIQKYANVLLLAVAFCWCYTMRRIIYIRPHTKLHFTILLTCVAAASLRWLILSCLMLIYTMYWVERILFQKLVSYKIEFIVFRIYKFNLLRTIYSIHLKRTRWRRRKSKPESVEVNMLRLEVARHTVKSRLHSINCVLERVVGEQK